MRTYFINYLAICSFFILIASCKKEATTNKPAAPTVYVLGTNNDNTLVYWKNGVASSLPASIAGGNALFVSGNSIYVAGGSSAYYSSTSGAAEYWKNGSITTLPDSSGHAFASSIFVSGSDVYVAGATYYPANFTVPYTTPSANYPKAGYVATYWKNGVSLELPGNGIGGQAHGDAILNFADYVSAMYVSGNDVYVAGGSSLSQQGNPNSYHFARYWKNGVPTDLVNGLVSTQNGSVTAFPAANSIFVSGSDVYVAGDEEGTTTQAIIWKNGTPTMLGVSATLSGANSVYVSGSDVYVAGFQTINNTTYATYWKNGTPVNLSASTASAGANSVFVSGSDVYVAGYETVNNITYATYWKNGTEMKLASNAVANSIYVQ